jgi:D-alanyl-D-alanine carboxypeptidase
MFDPITDIMQLSDTFRPKAERMLDLLKKDGVPVCVVETRRTKARQFFLWCKGRILDLPLEKQYLGYADPNILADPHAAIVTKTLNSRHLSGNAIDIVPTIDGKAWWDAPDKLWQRIYDIAEQCGICSCFRKNGFDRPHISDNGN